MKNVVFYCYICHRRNFFHVPKRIKGTYCYNCDTYNIFNYKRKYYNISNNSYYKHPNEKNQLINHKSLCIKNNNDNNNTFNISNNNMNNLNFNNISNNNIFNSSYNNMSNFSNIYNNSMFNSNLIYSISHNNMNLFNLKEKQYKAQLNAEKLSKTQFDILDKEKAILDMLNKTDYSVNDLSMILMKAQFLEKDKG